jgi:hypothetical protein
MCSLSLGHYRSFLQSGDIELEGSYLSLIYMQLVPVGALIGTGPCHMAIGPTVQGLPL